MAFILDPEFEKYATPKQWEKLKAWEQHGSTRRAAEAIGVHNRAIDQAWAAVQKKAAMHGFAPDHGWQHETLPGYVVKGVSTLRDMQTGEERLRWEKIERDKEAQLEAIREAVEDLTANVPRMRPVKAPRGCLSDLLNLYVLTDYHMGMLAWHREGGEDWDVSIATDTLVKSFSQMMAQSAEAETGFVCQLGDFLHTDYPAMASVTPMSKHDLDADGRPHKVIDATIHVLRSLVDMALSKHEKVIVLMAEGNHDMVSSIWLQCLFGAMYEKDPRVEVVNSPLPYYAHKHGETALFFHHGHLTKPAGLPGVFAAQFPKVWGLTKYRYGHCGHFHHKVRIDEKEDQGVSVTQHRTLAAKDAYSARGGYFAERKAECITYHRDHGQVSSVHVSPEMVQ